MNPVVAHTRGSNNWKPKRGMRSACCLYKSAAGTVDNIQGKMQGETITESLS